MSHVFIHVGLHKTASTFFQTEVFPHFENTICLTRPYTQQSRGFNKLQFADDTVYQPEELKIELEQINKENKNIIISDECLSGFPQTNYLNRSLIANRLNKFFPQAEIILFIRGQKNILLSLYNQYVKMGGTEPIHNYIWLPKEKYTYEMYCSQEKTNYWRKSTRYYNHLTKNINPQHFLYFNLIHLYHKYFSKVHVFLYEDFCQNPQQVITRIQKILRQPLKRNQNNFSKTNKKLSDRKIEITRYQNIVKPTLKTKNKYLIRLCALLYGSLIEPKKSKHSSFSHEEYVARLINNFYREDNQKIIKQYPHIGLQNYPQQYQL